MTKNEERAVTAITVIMNAGRKIVTRMKKTITVTNLASSEKRKNVTKEGESQEDRHLKKAKTHADLIRPKNLTIGLNTDEEPINPKSDRGAGDQTTINR